MGNSIQKGKEGQVRLTKEQVVERMLEGVYQEFPEQWVPDATGYILDDWQKELMRTLFLSNKPRTSVAASHGAGKTHMSAIIINFFLANFAPSKCAVTGPTGKQTRNQLWSSVATVWNRSVFHDDFEWFKTRMYFKDPRWSEEWAAVWVTSKDPKTIEGFHGPKDGENLIWICEESKSLDDAVFESIYGALTHENNFWYISSTCGGAHGFFYDTFYSKSHLWNNIRVPYYKSSRVSKKKVDELKETYGADSSIFRARMLAEFPEEDDKIICPLSWCERAVVRNEKDDDFEDDEEEA